MAERIRINYSPAKNCPCNSCTERFIACSGDCPKDNRGEYGYAAWHKELDRIKANRKAYMDLPFSKIT